jgi:hypothetical protein
VRAGGWLVAVGKRVGPKQLAGKVLDEAALRRLLVTKGAAR